MKRFLVTLAIHFVALQLTSAHAEDLAKSDPLAVPTFVPPVPKVRKEMPDISVNAAVEARMKNQKRLRIVRAEPSQLPDLPGIRKELARQAEAAESAVGEVAETNHKFIILGATVIDREISHVTWTDGSGKSLEALCGFDISLLAGVPGFTQGWTTYSLMLMHGQHVTKRDGGFSANSFPQLHVKRDEILLPAAAGEGIPEDLKTIGVLIGLERERLVEFQRARERRQEAERQWREANPEPPRDETIWLRPHSGSRYRDGAESSNTNRKGTDK